MRDPESALPVAPAWTIAAVRVYVGVIFAVAGIGQLLGAGPWGRATDWPTSLQRYFGLFRAKPAAFYSAFFQVLVVHRDLVAVLLPWIHVIIGVALVLGVATRFTTVLALLLLVNYMALTGVLPYSPGPISALAALALAVCLADPDVWRVGPALARWRSPSRGA